MMAVQKLYPRATVKRIVKSHTNKALTKNTDILVGTEGEPQYLYMRFR